ncbi:ribonuclease P protein component [Desulfofustis glycolicus]|uniref:ribonuclease P protein component n=1 Tax=Desulfofustis glycolicus TaxID=51195 RepID=UPI00093368AB|nr:ribonuclease P protein component [Desulfofustis glycolicus]MCB2215975.1 ribonuclease P protein component [Desulfobulbaceae bacterium]
MRRFGLPKYCLLRENREFDAVYRQGTRLYCHDFGLVFLANGRDYSRIGISVSRKLKGAVVRNRIKRICKESFRLSRDIYPRHADIVITVRPDFSLNSPSHIDQAVVRLLAATSV